MSVKIAVLIPCYNEEKTVGAVVEQAKKALSEADIYVYDNNSTDNTAKIAEQAGAIVRRVPLQGKGNVVRSMFSDIEADVYIMTDGDLTYDLTMLPQLVDLLISEQKDMVIGTRVEQEKAAYPAFHRFGNFFFTGLVRLLFGIKQTDMLSGLRVFSKRFVKTFTACSKGFEIETELNVFTAMNRLPFAEVETKYFARPEGSFRKLSTLRDGFKVSMMVIRLLRTERPALFYSLPTLSCALLTVLFSSVVYLGDLPVILAFIGFWFFLFCAVSFGEQTRNKREITRLSYMSYPFVSKED